MPQPIKEPRCGLLTTRAFFNAEPKAIVGIAKVVRIIPDPKKDIGLNIMSVFHYQRRVQIITCETLDQADQALAN